MLNETVKKVMKASAMETIVNLKKNKIDAYYVEKKEDVAAQVKALLKKGETVSFGGSMTLFETGVMDLLQNGDYHLLDRNAKGLKREDIAEIYRKSFYADTYLASANAITRHGEIYEVDGTGNRVAAITWGPKQVILIAGINKLTPDLKTAIERVKNIACPSNATRLNANTSCTKTGHCINPHCTENNLMALNAGSCPNSLCSISTVFSHQLQEFRIKVIITGDNLGF